MKRRQIPRHIGGAAGHKAFAHEVHNRHRRFGRNPPDLAPDELIEHHISHHDNARPASGGEQLLEPGGSDCFMFHEFRNPVKGLVALANSPSSATPTSKAIRPASTAIL